MSAPFNTGLRIAFILTVLFSGIVAPGQATQTASNSNALAVSLKMQTEQVQVGQMPWAILTVYNISDQLVTIGDSMYRVYVYGKDREAPTTLVQRQLTGRLRPGDVPLRGDDMVGPETVWPMLTVIAPRQIRCQVPRVDKHPSNSQTPHVRALTA
ncbi:MAG TPA: hypothetical protein VK638_28955 [Edaphobacter sp.]|nr:hypothetical protein [Edaphobacter sp.]